ncbi:hypothetical protein GQ53DRAFT_753540 [Thozetella sp. PMI_491]|nr:hypothetical protein GQ53DRAFT_753540 [Thozetella sp. PMI_491]
MDGQAGPVAALPCLQELLTASCTTGPLCRSRQKRFAQRGLAASLCDIDAGA